MNQYIIDLIFALIILLLPFIIYIHLLFDNEAQVIYVFGLQYPHQFISNQVFAWSVISNIVSLVFILLLYISSRGVWRYFLFILVFDVFSTILFTIFSGSNYLEFLLSTTNVLGNIAIILLFRYFEVRYQRDRINKLNLIPTRIIFRELISSWAYKFNVHSNELILRKTGFTLRAYLQRIYHLIQIFERKYNLNNRIDSEYKLLHQKGSIQAVLSAFIIIISVLIYADNFIPAGMDSIKIGNIEIGKYGFKDFATFFWHASRKFTLCFLGALWFVTSMNWWRWAILSPIIFYAYQFWESFQPVTEIDGAGNVKVFPLVFLTILGVLLLSKIIRRISINLDYQAYLREEFNRSLEELSRTPDYRIQ